MNEQWSKDPYPSPDCNDARARVIEVHKAYLNLLRNEPTLQQIDATLREEEDAAEKAVIEAGRQERDAEQFQPEVLGKVPASNEALNEPVVANEVTPKSEILSTVHPAEAIGIDTMASQTETPSQDVDPEVPLHVPGALSEASVENLLAIARRPRAGEERRRLQKFRNDSRFARKAWLVALYAIGIWMAYGLGSLLGVTFQSQVLAKMRLVAPAAAVSLPLVAGLAVLLVFACWGLARSQQLNRMATKTPREIPYLDNVGHIYEIEVYQGETEGTNPQLDKKLETQRKTLIGKTLDETREDLRLYRALFAVIVVIFTVPNVLFYPHRTVEQGILAVLVAAGPVAFAFFFSMLLANHTVDWPSLSEELMDPSDAQARLTQHENRLKEAAVQRAAARKAAEDARQKAQEAERRAAQLAAENHQRDLEKQAVAQARDAENRRIAALEDEKAILVRQHLATRAETVKMRFEMARKQYKTDAHDKLAELREAANLFENQRGYSKPEQSEMRASLANTKFAFWGLVILSGVAALFASYPASLTFAEIFNVRFQYLAGYRVAPPAWGLLCIFVIVAEYLIVSGIHKRKIAEEQHHVLREFYDEQERIQGLRYRIKTDAEVKQERKSTRILYLVGGTILMIEFLANTAFLLKNTDSNKALAIFLALVPLSLFVGLTFPNAWMHTRRHKLQEALSWARSLPLPQPLVLHNRNNAPGTSAEIRDLYERATGYVDPASPKRKVD